MITWFKNRKTSTKLIIGFVTVATLAGIVGLVGILNLIGIGQADKTLYEENTLGLSHAGTAEVYYQRIRYNALKALLVDGTDEQDAAIQNMRGYSLKVDEYLKKYEDGIITETDRQNFDALNQLWASYKENFEKAIVLIKENKDDEAKSLILNDMAVVGNGLQDAFDTIFTYNSESGKSKSDANQNLLMTAIIVMIAVVVIAVVVSVILGRCISALIGKPVRLFAEFAKMLAVGDVDAGKLVNEDERRELTSREDEVGELARSFETSDRKHL
jgi:methyl-accepting chemotaxis protein